MAEYTAFETYTDYGIFDCDQHIYEPVDCYTGWIEKKYADRTLRIVERDGESLFMAQDRPIQLDNKVDECYRPGSLKEMLKTMKAGADGGGYQWMTMDPAFLDRDLRLAQVDRQHVDAAVRFSGATGVLETFGEDAEPPTGGGLLRALGLSRRRGLARVEVDDALLAHGNEIVERQLGLDPREFRLVCIPQDLYARFGRDHAWGQRQQWTHFDGYQVLRNGQLRALAGGDVRYGGLNDLVSIELTDQRDSVIVRFAVIRRARHVARWL